MKRKYVKYNSIIVVLCLIICSIAGCRDKELGGIPVQKYFPPVYNSLELAEGHDTLRFPLKGITLKNIETVSFFIDKGVDYIAISDMQSLNIYLLKSQELVKKISIAQYIPFKKHYKTSVYCRNFDSIFISNNPNSLFVIDSAGRNKSAYYFPTNSFLTTFETNRPPIIKDSFLYAGIILSGELRSIKEINDFQLICRFDLKNRITIGDYHFSRQYRSHLYVYDFLNYSYSFNNRGNFIFSFPADSNLYETDFAGINIAYNSKSQFQQYDIIPLEKRKSDNGGTDRQYRTSSSYGSIYFDPYHKRYLRIFNQELSEKKFNAGERNQKSILIFNEELHIIGESPFPAGIRSSLSFTSDGGIYALLKPKDTSYLSFVRLIYKEKIRDSLPLAKISNK